MERRRIAEPSYDLIPIIERVVDEPEPVTHAFARLSRRQHEAMSLYYGFEDGQNRTYAQVGAEMGVARRRARKLVKKALSNIKHPVRVDRRPTLEEIFR